MFLRTFLSLLVCTLVVLVPSTRAQSPTDDNEGVRIAPDPTAPGALTLSWWGRPGRTYFVQGSDDLKAGTWTYLPVIEPGTGQPITWAFSSSTPKFFVRLLLSDIPTSDPFNDDFDGDGVSNWDELLQGTDPFSVADTNNNGLADDWEKRFFGFVGVDPNADYDGDGLTNIQEFQFHTDPISSFNNYTGASSDTDHNSLLDWWETAQFGHIGNNPNQAAPNKGGLTLKQVHDYGLSMTRASTVNDGIPDAWKILHGLDPQDQFVGSEDPDGDGMSNAEEYAAGTDPMNWDTDGDYTPDGEDIAPLVPNPAPVQSITVAVPSWEAQQQQTPPDYSLVDYTAIEVRWTVASYGGAPTGYRVEKRIDNNPWKELATIGAGTTMRADQGLVASRNYQYRVVALLDADGAHIEAEGAEAAYQVPLGLRMDVKQSSHTRSKQGWSEFVNPSTPPKYYLIQTDFSTYADNYSEGGTDWSHSRTASGQRTGTETWLPGIHSHLIDVSYTYNRNESASDATSSSTGSYTGTETSHLLQQRRGRGVLRSVDQYQHDDNWTDNWSGSEPAGGWSDIVTFKERFDHDFGAQYQPTAGTPKWMGEDFNLSKGTLLWSGTSNWLRDPHRRDVSGVRGNGWSNWMFEAHGTRNPDGTWSTTGHNHYYGSEGSYSESSGSGSYQADSNDSGATGPWTGGLVEPASPTQKTFHSQGTYAHGAWAQDRTLTLSQEYTTPAFTQDVTTDLPDYPDDWNANFYGWNLYPWGYWGWEGWGYAGTWYSYGYPWYGWWVGERHLSKNETSFTLAKLKYRFAAKPSDPVNMKWYEVFVPDDDPGTTDVDESKDIRIVAERTWRLGAGQPESAEYEIDPSGDTKNGYYTVLIAPVHLSVPGVGEAGKDVAGGLATDPGKAILIDHGDADGDGIPDYADGYKLHADVPEEAQSYGNTFVPLKVNWQIVDPLKAKVRFTYDASDPRAVTLTADGTYTLPGGHLRLWTKDGGARDGRGIKAGGDYIESGVEYTLADLGFNGSYYYATGMTVYVEAVAASAGVADLPVKVEVNPNGSLGYVWSDQLRFTAVGIENPYILTKPNRQFILGSTLYNNSASQSNARGLALSSQQGMAMQPEGVFPTELPWYNDRIPTNGSGLVVKRKTIHVRFYDSGNAQDGDLIDVILNHLPIVRVPLTFAGTTIPIQLQAGVNEMQIRAVNLGTKPFCTFGVEFDKGEVVNARIMHKPENFYIPRYNLNCEGALIPGFPTASVKIGFPIIHMKPNWPESAQHAQEAINKGWPTVLTIDRAGRIQRGEDSRAAYDANPVNPRRKDGQDRDEYPQALFLENGGHADVKCISSSDNQSSGASIGGQCRPFQTDGDVIEIEVDKPWFWWWWWR